MLCPILVLLGHWLLSSWLKQVLTSMLQEWMANCMHVEKMWWCRPKPLYHSTASQMGLHKTKGIPNLLDYVLPRNAPQVSTPISSHKRPINAPVCLSSILTSGWLPHEFEGCLHRLQSPSVLLLGNTQLTISPSLHRGRDDGCSASCYCHLHQEWPPLRGRRATSCQVHRLNLCQQEA